MEEKKKKYYSEVQMRATDRYVAANYDKIMFKVRKGKKDKIKQLAESQGMSMQAFIIAAIEKEAERLCYDLSVPPTPSQQSKLNNKTN